jgi:hypothetical protein
LWLRPEVATARRRRADGFARLAAGPMTAADLENSRPTASIPPTAITAPHVMSTRGFSNHEVRSFNMSNILPHNEKPNYFTNYARAVLARRLDGERLRFDKGAYLVGEFGALESGTQLVAVMSQLKIGWIKWHDGEVVDHRLGYVSEGYVPPRRSELDDYESNNWENVNGELRDPWKETNELVMIAPETGKIYTFTTGARGGFSAIAELAAGYSDELPFYPLVELGSSSYQHKNKSFGRIHVPVFTVLKNVDAEKYDNILAASRAGGSAPSSGAAPAVEQPKSIDDLPPPGVASDYTGHHPDDDVHF